MHTLHNKRTNSRWQRAMACLPVALTLAGLFPFSSFAAGPTGGVGGLNPGSPGGQKPTTYDVAWTVDPGKSFLRFTLIEFPGGVVTDIGNTSSWQAVGTPLNVVWTQGNQSTWTADFCRSKIVWFDSNAMLFNSQGANAAQLMAGTVSYYSAASGNNQRRVMTASEFAAESGITAAQMDQIFHCASPSWSTSWLDGDYTSMWGTDPKPVTPNNLYKVYKPNKAFLYLLGRLSETGGAGTGWSRQDAISHWCEYVHDASGNLRTKYRIIVEPGVVFQDPDGVYRANTLREAMAYSLYNNEPMAKYNLIWDQNATILNMAQWMRQAKNNQFLEYPLDASGNPTGEELHSVNGFTEADSFVDSITSAPKIRSTIFAERRSYGLHIFSPFNFEHTPPASSKPYLEVTKQAGGSIPAGTSFGFTVTYTSGAPTGFTAFMGGMDCTSQVTSTGSGLKFSLKAGETIRIDFEADESFRFEVTEDDPSQLVNISGSGGTADMTAKKFVSTGGAARAVFTNGTTPDEPEPEEPVEPPKPPKPAETILYKRDAQTNAGVGPATFKFSSVTNGDYEFDTDESGALESVQWWDPTEESGKYIKPGEYAVTELIPPPGYEGTTEIQQIKLELDDNGYPIPAGPLVFKNQAKPGLKIVKYDSQSHKPMAGVTFEIFKDGTSIGRKETDSSGVILLSGIEAGTYRAVEVDTGDDGHILDTGSQEVELTAGGGVKELVFFNDNKPGLKLVKVDSSDLSKTIAGAKFRIEAVDGSYGPQEFTTDASGEINLSDLEPGVYSIVETAAPLDPILDQTEHHVELTAGKTAEIRLTNDKKPALRLIKTSSDGSNLAGVHFRIAKIEDGTHYLDRITDANGEINISGLEPGVYSVKETATTKDHILDLKEYHVELFPNKTSTLAIENQKRPSLIISKTDKDTGTPVPGVTFTLRGVDGPTITTKPTDADGKIVIENLLPGVYTITEQSVPENYILDTTPQTVTLFANREAQVEFQNYQRPTLKITKVDINGKHLTRAIFEVKTKAGVKIGDFPVGADGTVTISNVHLDEGYYLITEIQAPKGYILDKTPHEVYLRPGRTTEVTIENEKKPGLTIYKVDSVVGDGVKGAKFEIWVSKDKTEHGTYQKLNDTFYYTDENGMIELPELDTGWYNVKEVEPPAGYMLKEPSEQILYVEHDKGSSITFENTPKSALVIRKIDSDTGAPAGQRLVPGALPGRHFRHRRHRDRAENYREERDLHLDRADPGDLYC